MEVGWKASVLFVEKGCQGSTGKSTQQFLKPLGLLGSGNRRHSGSWRRRQRTGASRFGAYTSAFMHALNFCLDSCSILFHLGVGLMTYSAASHHWQNVWGLKFELFLFNFSIHSRSNKVAKKPLSQTKCDFPLTSNSRHKTWVFCSASRWISLQRISYFPTVSSFFIFYISPAAGSQQRRRKTNLSAAHSGTLLQTGWKMIMYMLYILLHARLSLCW